MVTMLPRQRRTRHEPGSTASKSVDAIKYDNTSINKYSREIFIIYDNIRYSRTILQSLKRSIFPLFLSLTVRLPCAHRAFSVRSPCIHLLFTIRSLFLVLRSPLRSFPALNKTLILRSQCVNYAPSNRSAFDHRSGLIHLNDKL